MEKEVRPTRLRPLSSSSSRSANRWVADMGSRMEASAAAERTNKAPGTLDLTRATRGEGSGVPPATSMVICRVYLEAKARKF